MKTSLTADDLWNIGFDRFFDRNVKIPIRTLEGLTIISKGRWAAKAYREALNGTDSLV